jgi:UDP-N-acetylglucosamine 2-epimerase (non-hydrolysing)
MRKRGMPHFVVHTGQHYSREMDEIFFLDLKLKWPLYTNPLTRTCKYHGAQTAEMLRFTEAVFLDQKPGRVIVGGDANTNLAGALAARKLGLRLYHLEAGLRSNDWRMPEEHNRVMIDHISDVLFAPTEYSNRNLFRENVKGECLVVGNTIVDALNLNTKIADGKSKILEVFNLEPRKYAVLTLHREETVDDEKVFRKLIENVHSFLHEDSIKAIFPVHPRTDMRIREYGMNNVFAHLKWITMIEPLGYLDFLKLLNHADFAMTDSGGVQEEACILNVPCYTLRQSTERPETEIVGANIIVGSVGELLENYLLEPRNEGWRNPFGDGKTAERICDYLEKETS